LIDQPLAPQYAEHGFRDEGAIVRTQRGTLPKEVMQHCVGRLVEFQDHAKRFGSGLQLMAVNRQEANPGSG
jgi:hypothetical protein